MLRLQGQCAATLDWDMLFYHLNATYTPRYVKGNVTVAAMPGSTRVWDRTKKEIVSPRELCVMAFGS